MDFKTDMRLDTLDMRQNILTIKQFLPKLLTLGFLLLACFGCKKADNFYEKLQDLPQIDYSGESGLVNKPAYKPAYIIGDTMVITGKLHPKNNLQITIGGNQAAIIKTDSIKDGHNTWLDQVYLLIASEMVGKAKEVKITSSGYSILGANIDVYTPGGPGSFDKNLQSVLIKSFTNGGQNIFLHCQNGKGDVYYYSAANKDLRHVAKDGTETILYNLSGTLNPGGAAITTFLAGGVDPQGQNLYFSAQTSPTDYVFCKINLVNKQLTVLNRSQNTATPYEGTVSSVKMIVSGIYPDSRGNVYLAIGFNQREVILPDAIAKYSSADNRVSYIYKKLIVQNTFPGMPGTNIDLTSSNVIALRFSPDENLLYVMEQSFRDYSAMIDVYDIGARIKVQNFTTSNSANSLSNQVNVIAPFLGLQINLGTGATPDESFGYLPMPGKRLQVLLYQVFSLPTPDPNSTAKYGFPKWMVFDFAEKRTYAYATGRFEQNDYIFEPSNSLFPQSRVRDELLNYDEAGNLYATANGKAVLIRTQPVN